MQGFELANIPELAMGAGALGQARDLLVSLQKGGVTARIERRSWYVGGRYLGNLSPFTLVMPAEMAQELTGDFYGEWQGLRHFDGAEILRSAIEHALDYHIATSARNAHHGDLMHHPMALGDWGEYRVVTNDDGLYQARSAA